MGVENLAIWHPAVGKTGLPACAGMTSLEAREIAIFSDLCRGVRPYPPPEGEVRASNLFNCVG